jgi:DNA replication protein DnaC
MRYSTRLRVVCLRSRTVVNGYPQCLLCHGRGVIQGKRMQDNRVCVCVLAKKRVIAARSIRNHAFSGRERAMTLKAFKTGDIEGNLIAVEAARAAVEMWKTPKAGELILGFSGDPRVGKTHLAVAVAQCCTERFLYKPVLLNLPHALKRERQRYDNRSLSSPFQAASAADLIILDDLGAEYVKEASESWAAEQLLEVLEARTEAQLPTIYTSNLSEAALLERYGHTRLGSQVCELLRTEQIRPAVAVLKVEREEGESLTADPGAASLLLAARPKLEDESLY